MVTILMMINDIITDMMATIIVSTVIGALALFAFVFVYQFIR